MNMTLKSKIFLVGLALLASYAFGRFSAPEKVKIEKQIVEVEKKVTDRDAEKNTKKTTTTTKITHPDGRVEETTTVVEETNRKSSKTETSESGKSSSETTETTYSSSKVSVSGLWGIQIGTPGVVYGASISKPILGPITVGAFGLSNGIVGGSIGLTF